MSSQDNSKNSAGIAQLNVTKDGRIKYIKTISLNVHYSMKLQKNVIPHPHLSKSTDMLPEKYFGKSPLLECYLSKSLKVSEFYCT